jgi:hypothetical protein
MIASNVTHNVVEPTVVDDELLSKAVNEQATGDAAEIARKEGIDFKEVVFLRLDFKSPYLYLNSSSS